MDTIQALAKPSHLPWEKWGCYSTPSSPGSYAYASGGERAWYTLQAHVPGDPRKTWGNWILHIVYSLFIVHRTARHAKPTSDHHGNATGRHGDASACAHNVYQALSS